MSQTQQHKNGQTTPTPAPTNAVAAPKPADAKPTDTSAKSTETIVTPATAGADPAKPEPKKREVKRKVFIVVGEVREFESIVQAEKFLNGPEAPAAEFSVIQGTRGKTNKRVSLR